MTYVLTRTDGDWEIALAHTGVRAEARTPSNHDAAERYSRVHGHDARRRLTVGIADLNFEKVFAADRWPNAPSNALTTQHEQLRTSVSG